MRRYRPIRKLRFGCGLRTFFFCERDAHPLTSFLGSTETLTCKRGPIPAKTLMSSECSHLTSKPLVGCRTDVTPNRRILLDRDYLRRIAPAHFVMACQKPQREGRRRRH